MSKYSEILKFDLESLTTLSEIYFGYAEALTKSEDARNYPYIASCYSIAAIYKSIVSPGSGTASFQKASEYYKKEGNVFWVICSACAYDTNQVAQFFNQKEENSELTKGLLENVLAAAIVDKNINQEFIYNSLVPVGRLNIPVKIYLDALKDVWGIKINANKVSIPFDHVLSFLKRASESIYLLKEDSFHWQNLYGNFIPLEPEILGFCIAICIKLKEIDISINKVFEQLEIDPIAKLPLQIADDITNIFYSK